MSRSLDPNPLVAAALELRQTVSRLRFGPPVAHVYNPLDYAWSVHAAYLRLCGAAPKRVVFLGMNPGPFGMMQTGVPFGEIAAVRDWIGLEKRVSVPTSQHPARPIEGFACARSEVSGRRLWGLFSERFGTAKSFFRDHLVLNYCPLAFLEESGRNVTPDKLPAAERATLIRHCDKHLVKVLDWLRPTWAVGVGEFAYKRLSESVSRLTEPPQIGKIAHPSPASPAANKDWTGLATRQLRNLGVWR